MWAVDEKQDIKLLWPYTGGPQIHGKIPKIIMKMGTQGPQNFMIQNVKTSTCHVLYRLNKEIPQN